MAKKLKRRRYKSRRVLRGQRLRCALARLLRRREARLRKLERDPVISFVDNPVYSAWMTQVLERALKQAERNSRSSVASIDIRRAIWETLGNMRPNFIVMRHVLNEATMLTNTSDGDSDAEQPNENSSARRIQRRHRTDAGVDNGPAEANPRWKLDHRLPGSSQHRALTVIFDATKRPRNAARGGLYDLSGFSLVRPGQDHSGPSWVTPSGPTQEFLQNQSGPSEVQPGEKLLEAQPCRSGISTKRYRYALSPDQPGPSWVMHRPNSHELPENQPGSGEVSQTAEPHGLQENVAGSSWTIGRSQCSPALSQVSHSGESPEIPLDQARLSRVTPKEARQESPRDQAGPSWVPFKEARQGSPKHQPGSSGAESAEETQRLKERQTGQDETPTKMHRCDVSSDHPGPSWAMHRAPQQIPQDPASSRATQAPGTPQQQREQPGLISAIDGRETRNLSQEQPGPSGASHGMSLRQLLQNPSPSDSATKKNQRELFSGDQPGLSGVSTQNCVGLSQDFENLDCELDKASTLSHEEDDSKEFIYRKTRSPERYAMRPSHQDGERVRKEETATQGPGFDGDSSGQDKRVDREELAHSPMGSTRGECVPAKSGSRTHQSDQGGDAPKEGLRSEMELGDEGDADEVLGVQKGSAGEAGANIALQL
ncbi:hypothetical protein BIW11_12608 [Tropilaelaps mercedesae]|uniref:Uncharacterized protein n=1 Tax=Tropilaelaps mercedesae TaxID=418985 RepID=A0A1V9X676_9ACAR|nr:hypothetical protein BIW11_12608 [Tropilaelaps mercedesae]